LGEAEPPSTKNFAPGGQPRARIRRFSGLGKKGGVGEKAVKRLTQKRQELGGAGAGWARRFAGAFVFGNTNPN